MNGKKKTIADMTSSWMHDHAVNTAPSEWAKAIGIGDPETPSPEKVAAAWETLSEIGMLGSMLDDVVDAIALIRACPEITSMQRDVLRKTDLLAMAAVKNYRKIGDIISESGVKLEQPESPEAPETSPETES